MVPANTTPENCKKLCTVKKECLYFMWSDGKGNAESNTRCYLYGNFGTKDKDYKTPGTLGYKTYSNCGRLFRQYTSQVLIS
jgi:hypothetical protein